MFGSCFRTRAVNFELLSLCSRLKGLSVFLSESQSLPDDFGNLWYTCSPVVVYFQLMPEQIVTADGWVAVKTGVLAYVKYPERSKFGSSFALSYTYCLAGCQVCHWNSLCRPIGLVQERWGEGVGGSGMWGSYEGRGSKNDVMGRSFFRLASPSAVLAGRLLWH